MYTYHVILYYSCSYLPCGRLFSDKLLTCASESDSDSQDSSPGMYQVGDFHSGCWHITRITNMYKHIRTISSCQIPVFLLTIHKSQTF